MIDGRVRFENKITLSHVAFQGDPPCGSHCNKNTMFVENEATTLCREGCVSHKLDAVPKHMHVSLVEFPEGEDRAGKGGDQHRNVDRRNRQ